MQTEAAKSQIRKAESDGMPTLNLVATSGMSWIDLNKEAVTPTNRDRREDTYFAGLTFSIPIFNGYSTTYTVERAKLDAESAGERTKGLEQLAVSQVFTAYHALRTASKKVHTSDDLIKSAEQNEEVAMGRYKEGVGTILDLVTAQASLADARTQAISARWEWKTALAQLAHDTGKLELAGQPVK
jgi:outer membrane protein TolC